MCIRHAVMRAGRGTVGPPGDPRDERDDAVREQRQVQRQKRENWYYVVAKRHATPGQEQEVDQENGGWKDEEDEKWDV